MRAVGQSPQRFAKQGFGRQDADRRLGRQHERGGRRLGTQGTRRGRPQAGGETEILPQDRRAAGIDGKPYKIKLKDRDVFLCCDGCEEAVKKDPEKYLKKLDDLLKKK